MESLCRSGSTQESNPVGCSERWAATVAVSFSQTKTVHGVLRKLPRGTKIAVEATGSWWWFVEKEMGHDVCLLISNLFEPSLVTFGYIGVNE